MTIESPKRNIVAEKMGAFIDAHPEYKEKDFSQKEILDAAQFANARVVALGERIEDMGEDLVQRALDARFDVRGTAGKTPVLDDQGLVIGMAGSMEEAKKIFREDSETRDSV